MPIEPWFERAVDIEVPAPAGQQGRRGSGYMIAPGIILTALHVVIGAGRVPDGVASSCRVRMLADIQDFAGADAAMRTAKLVWPPAGTDRDDGDIALLSVDGTLTDNMHQCDPLPVLDARIECEVAGCGLPEFVRIIRDVKAVDEGFWIFRGRAGDRPVASNTLADFLLRDQRAPEPEEWRGASGSALIHEDSKALVGVLVHADHSRYKRLKGDAPRPLVVETVATFAADPDFQKVVTLQVVTRSDLEKRRGVPRYIITRASKLLPHLDRNPQRIELKGAFRTGPNSFTPMVVIARMREYDRPDLFLRTVGGHLAEVFKDRRCCYEDPQELSWDKDLPPDEAVASLKRQLPGNYDAWDDQAFDELLRGGQKPRLYPVRIDADIQPPTREAFEALLSWWSKRTACEGGPATLLLSVIESTDTPDGPACQRAEAIVEAAKPFFPGQGRCRLPTLRLCTLADLDSWQTAVLRKATDPHTQTIVTQLTRAAGQASAPLRVYAEALQKMDLAG